jgi:hypothetical protein
VGEEGLFPVRRRIEALVHGQNARQPQKGGDLDGAEDADCVADHEIERLRRRKRREVGNVGLVLPVRPSGLREHVNRNTGSLETPTQRTVRRRHKGEAQIASAQPLEQFHQPELRTPVGQGVGEHEDVQAIVRARRPPASKRRREMIVALHRRSRYRSRSVVERPRYARLGGVDSDPRQQERPPGAAVDRAAERERAAGRDRRARREFELPTGDRRIGVIPQCGDIGARKSEAGEAGRLSVDCELHARDGFRGKHRPTANAGRQRVDIGEWSRIVDGCPRAGRRV